MTEQPHKDGQASSYAAAGVNITDADSIKARIQTALSSTLDARTLGVGSFGSLFSMESAGDLVLVSSCDGVGTKLKIAALLGRNRSVGHDIVNHCINDILCCGAMPLFFLDYIAMARLDPVQVADIVEGLAEACRASGVALIGGETAEMPGFYTEGIYDLVGFIVGAVERRNVIDGRNIEPGDVLLGLPSSGLHTNGYSLARKVFNVDGDPARLRRTEKSLGRPLGDALLEPHRPYHSTLAPHLSKIKGLAAGVFEELFWKRRAQSCSQVSRKTRVSSSVPSPGPISTLLARCKRLVKIRTAREEMFPPSSGKMLQTASGKAAAMVVCTT
jgi:phosphoribosylformylglycinamidine cyclo-ligase